MEPITREEKIMSGENLTPITRKELFLAKAAGQDVETPMPITREEMFLDKIQGGGGGSALPSQQKTIDITENGTVEITPNYGYTLSKVTVNVNVEGTVEVFVATSDVEIFVVHNGVFTLQDFLLSNGVNANVAIQIVQTLPEKLIESNVNYAIYVYVVDSTGIAYVDLGLGTMTAGLALLDDIYLDRGWATDINSVTENGVYCVRKTTAYNVKRIDELPTDAVDGSMAIVESEREAMANTTWVLNEYFESKSIDENKIEYLPIRFGGYLQNGAAEEFIGILFKDFVDGWCEIVFVMKAAGTIGLYDDGWVSDECRTINIYEEPTTYVSEWIRTHATRQDTDGDKTYITTKNLYIRENGEWVYKSEVA